MFLNFYEKVTILNDFLFGWFDNFINSFSMLAWVSDAVIDSFHTLPFLFLAFLFIEFFEYFYANKINSFMKKSGKAGPLIGSLAAVIPQCGFSIIASSLYTKKLITRGTLIAIYLATSDEAVPVLLSYPEKIYLVLPVIIAKLIIAITAGYIIDLIFKSNVISDIQESSHEQGCCRHDILASDKINLWLHPLKHTINVFLFILVITLFLNFFINDNELINLFSSNNLGFKIAEPVITGIIGLIPNCAVSIALTMLLIKGTISFGAAIAGLCSNAGLGLLVLLRKNENIKDSVFLITLLVIISILSGLILQLVRV